MYIIHLWLCSMYSRGILVSTRRYIILVAVHTCTVSTNRIGYNYNHLESVDVSRKTLMKHYGCRVQKFNGEYKILKTNCVSNSDNYIEICCIKSILN